MRKLLIAALSVLALIVLAGCASVPQAEIDAATTALTEAKTAGADVYAAESLQAALDKESALNAELATQQGNFFKSYDLTAQLAGELKQLAEKAKTDAVAGKEQAKLDAEAAITATEAAITAAQEALKTAPKGKGSAADLAAMTGDVEAAVNAIAECKTMLGEEKYLDVKTKAESAKAQADKVVADIQAAIEMKKGRK